MESFADIKDKQPRVFDQGCSSRVILDHVMSKWGVLVLACLSDGTLRWGELRRAVDGISEKMLASTLRTLGADGLVLRESLPTVPPHVEYSLTPLGRELMQRMLPLLDWVVDHADGMLADRVSPTAIPSPAGGARVRRPGLAG
ncbi:helix-turn-helix domain-containing protein [Tsukamurella sp. 8F]|uniref:winged helix-turn-helix transcriptional regulator n=1 Tax=unclassified Tsukamurella TaxID=2633480 RepID=UPI0023B8E369|nr:MULTISPECIES: helix-turn-helix domain-containing protein [unclassified Tsukamurella]MDF0528476.1 helix-turn-helix domain-containing protein [Tsukamurella sp. 8J]MDF0586302.1 helix-turn-helix domain-containing protein [Tsukamurella sp. 8F]